jgi:hypothetical protein
VTRFCIQLSLSSCGRFSLGLDLALDDAGHLRYPNAACIAVTVHWAANQDEKISTDAMLALLGRTGI